MKYDYIIIGGGIVGISTAWQLQQRHPDKKILLAEKESRLAYHQTSHNSGVIHAGVYYAPGSLKARFCREGAAATLAFCRQHDIPHDQCGKLIVATNASEYMRLLALHQRCSENHIAAELLDQRQLTTLEANITGVGAVLVKQTGIVNYRQISEKMAQQFVQLGGDICLGCQITGIDETPDQVRVTARDQGKSVTMTTDYLIACGGLMADRLTLMMGIETDFQIIPFRGEYYQLPARHNGIVKHLIYPVPDPELPFLGIHLTRMIDGSVTVGPNAVQGFKREGYGKLNFSWRDTAQMLRFKGFWRVAKNHLKSGLTETKNAWYKPGYLKQVQKYCPQLRLADLQPYPAGVRAQAVMRDGTLVHDFLFAHSPRSLHVCNAPSPAATAAIPIGGYICDKVEQQLKNGLA